VESVDILKEYRFVDDEKRRVVTARSLQGMQRIDSNAALMEMAEDESFIIRTMIKIMQDKEKK